MSDALPAAEPAARAREQAPPEAAAPVLAARRVRKSFRVGDRTLEVLHGIDFALRSGELVALVGASGAGKSTLLHVLGLLERPTEGTVEIAGVDGWACSTTQRARLRNRDIGFVFQFYHLLPELDALENALLPAMVGEKLLGWRRRKRELVERARELLDRFGMTPRLRHRPPQLSGGERQRVAIARALLNDPRVVLADEPTGNLDSATGERVLELLLEEQRRRELSMVIVTHDERIARVCARTVHLEDGLVQADSSVPVPD